MNQNKQIDVLEKKITGIMSQIKNRHITMSDSKIGKYLNKLKPLDLVSYENFLKEYKKVVQDIKNPI